MTAFDMLDQVHCAMVVQASTELGPVSSEVAHASTTTVLGTGESDPREWARDALVAMLETL